MARNTKKSLAGSAASAARRVLRPKSKSADSAASDTAAPAKKTTATKKTAAAKKAAPAKKATAAKKAAPAKKATAATKAAPAKKTAAAKKTAPAKKATAAKKTTPAKKTTAAKKTTPTEKTAPAKKAPAAKKTAPAKKAPAAKKTAPAKKAAAKKAATSRAAALPVLESEAAWSKAEIAEVVRELHEQREHSERILEAQQADLTGLLHDAGDGAGQDQADVGATSFERDHELTVLNHEREKVAQIDRALARIEDGTYGLCERCGNPIGKNRLMAFPRATLCMTCKQREERR